MPSFRIRPEQNAVSQPNLISIDEAKRLLAATYTSVHVNLLEQYAHNLKDVNGPAIFTASDVQNILGNGAIERLRQSGIKAVYVPKTDAAKYGEKSYKHDMIILDQGALSELSNRTFNLRPTSHSDGPVGGTTQG